MTIVRSWFPHPPKGDSLTTYLHVTLGLKWFANNAAPLFDQAKVGFSAPLRRRHEEFVPLQRTSIVESSSNEGLSQMSKKGVRVLLSPSLILRNLPESGSQQSHFVSSFNRHQPLYTSRLERKRTFTTTQVEMSALEKVLTKDACPRKLSISLF